jgi:hypothetical protein
MKLESKNFLKSINNLKTFSQAGQDLFVTRMLNNKIGGFFIEVGGSHPFESNNTILLEKDFKWNGISLEFDSELVSLYNDNRINKSILTDATSFDYLKYFIDNNLPKTIDYLSLDIEPASNTYKAMLKIPFHEYRFSVITYEHENYKEGPEYMNLSRKFLKSHGYQLVVSNVNAYGRDFEDWWIDPNSINQDIWENFINRNIEFKDIFK